MSLSQKDKELIDKYAKKIVDKGWGTIAILWLDGTSYLSNIASQMLHVINPTLNMIPYISTIFKDSNQVAEILEEKENVEYFLTKIELFMNEENEKKEKQKLLKNNDKK